MKLIHRLSGSLVLSMLRLLCISLLLSKVLLREGVGWHPRSGLASARDLAVQLVDLLQGEALGLVDVEVHKRDAQEAAGKPDEEDLGLQVGVAVTVVNKVRRGVGNGPVEQPLN